MAEGLAYKVSGSSGKCESELCTNQHTRLREITQLTSRFAGLAMCFGRPCESGPVGPRRLSAFLRERGLEDGFARFFGRLVLGALRVQVEMAHVEARAFRLGKACDPVFAHAGGEVF